MFYFKKNNCYANILAQLFRKKNLNLEVKKIRKTEPIQWEFEDIIWILPIEGKTGYIEQLENGNLTGKVLAVKDNAIDPGTKVILEEKEENVNLTDGQMWLRGKKDKDGFFSLKNLASERFLTAEDSTETIIADMGKMKTVVSLV